MLSNNVHLPSDPLNTIAGIETILATERTRDNWMKLAELQYELHINHPSDPHKAVECIQAAIRSLTSIREQDFTPDNCRTLALYQKKAGSILELEDTKKQYNRQAAESMKRIPEKDRTPYDWVNLSLMLHDYADYTPKLDRKLALSLFLEAIDCLKHARNGKHTPQEWCYLASYQSRASAAAADLDMNSEAIIYSKEAIATMKHIIKKKESPSFLKKLADLQISTAKIYGRMDEIALEIESYKEVIKTYNIIKEKYPAQNDVEMFEYIKSLLGKLNTMHNEAKGCINLSPDNDLITSIKVQIVRCGVYDLQGQHSDAFVAINKLYDNVDKLQNLYIGNNPVVSLDLYASYGLKVLHNIAHPQFKIHATRYLTYLDNKMEEEIINTSSLLRKFIKEDTDAHNKLLQEIEDQKHLPEKSKSMIIVPPLFVDATRAMFKLRNELKFNTRQASTWVMNPGLLIFMIQGWNRNNSAGNKVDSVLPSRLWLTILTFIGDLSLPEAKFLHDTMSFFARKRVLLGGVKKHLPTSNSSTVLNKMDEKITPTPLHPYQDKAIILNQNITNAKSNENLFTELEKEVTSFATEELNTNGEKSQEYPLWIETNFKRLSSRWC